METSINTTYNVHVKLQYGDDYRRFFIERKSSFTDLIAKIKTLLGISSDFVVKYRDEENEWITISSDIELETGIIISSSIFRLQVCLLNTLSQSAHIEPVCVGPICTDPISQSTVGCQISSNDEDNHHWRKRKCDRYCYGHGRGRKNWKNKHCDQQEHVDHPGHVNPLGHDSHHGHGKKDWKNKDCGDWRNKKWEKRDFYRKKREERNAQEQSPPEKEDTESNSGSETDAVLNLEEIKKEIGSLKEELGLLNEKKRGLHAEVKDINANIKIQRQKEVVNKEEILAEREKIQVKRDSINNIKDQIKQTKDRLHKLSELATTKKE